MIFASPYAWLGAAVVLEAAVFVTYLAMVRQRTVKTRAALESLGSSVEGLNAEFDRLKSAMQTAEHDKMDALRSQHQKFLRFSDQAQMLTMHKAGQSISAIASSLRVTRGEVTLAIRFQEIQRLKMQRMAA